MNGIKTLEKYIKELEKENKELKDKLNAKKNSGRKPKVFKDSDIELIKMYRIQGYSIRELANMFNCSIGLMHRIITKKD